MKKKFGFYILACALVAVVILMLGISVMVSMHESEIADYVSPTRADIEEMRARLAKVSEEATAHANTTDKVVCEGEAEAEPVLPSGLEGTVSAEALVERFGERRPGELRDTQLKAKAFKVLEGVSSFVNQEQAGGWAWERGQELMSLGQWDAARRCFWVALDSPLDPGIHKFAAAKLAWLEDDPEKALQYLELSCYGENCSHWLINAVDLCEATGSDALAEHYLARLRTEYPELEQLYSEGRR